MKNILFYPMKRAYRGQKVQMKEGLDIRASFFFFGFFRHEVARVTLA